MRQVEVDFRGITSYSQSRKVMSPKKERETDDEHEKRTWRERMHVDQAGNVVMPQMAFKHCLDNAIRALGIKIPGKGNKQWTSVFEAGTLVLDAVVLPIKAEDVPGEELFVPSDGVPGSGKRVWKTFPRIDNWGGTVRYIIVDDLITEDIFRRGINHAGSLVGLGRFRPAKRGFYGRFEVTDIRWEELD